MKEKIKEHKKELIIGGFVSLLIALGMKKSYDKGYQRGSDVLFFRVLREFPHNNYDRFLEKYHK